MANIPDLSDDRWDELLERSTRHASCKLAKLTWRGVRRGSAPGGIEAPDLAATALELVILGKRSWDRAAYPDFEVFLRGVVDSLISNLVRSLENRRTRRIGHPDPAEESSDPEGFAGREPGPVELLVSREDQEAFRAAVIKALEGDGEAFQVLECLEAGITKPAEIAAYLGLPVSEINNTQRRLRRKLGSFKPKGKGGRRG